jgi:hypothetical protein
MDGCGLLFHWFQRFLREIEPFRNSCTISVNSYIPRRSVDGIPAFAPRGNQEGAEINVSIGSRQRSKRFEAAVFDFHSLFVCQSLGRVTQDVVRLCRTTFFSCF